MLQIKDIRKQYKTGELVQTALDGVSLTLRDNEFVAILGPSGSGKTTLLNVIGGLDRYDSGDLIINGVSTKKYSDRDWDSYRNHTIGFVFQSYNLIPHQTVLANVELALTISGISRSERRRRAKKALEDVGLGDQLHKKPNQMSGGQMQRVAIARALVNNPAILLADEPTGALDSETSVQVMELLKEVAHDRLVVMVTHNPELAESYANRIVRVKDGRIIDDSNPCVPAADAAPAVHKNMGRSSMSFLTALTLSFNNLWTKKARTLLTAFAGSIGIIGIALIMALSTGFQIYIDKIQEDTLSNYPLTIQGDTADMTSAFMSIGAQVADSSNAPAGVVREQQMITQVMGQMGSNDIGSFKYHLERNYDQVADAINAIRYGYGIQPLIYREDTSDRIVQVNPASLFADLTGSAAMSSYLDSNVFQEMIGNLELLESQYDVLRGRWPEHYNEMVIVLADPHQFTDYMAYTLGMRDSGELDSMVEQLMEGLEPEITTTPMEWTYDDLMNLRFRLVAPSDFYQYNEEYGVWEDMSNDQTYVRQLIANGEELRIVGIVCAKEGVSATALSAGIAYTADLTEHIIGVAERSRIVQDQLADKRIDVFTGKEFGAEEEEEDSGLNFEDMISIDQEMLSEAFGMNVSQDQLNTLVNRHIEKISGSITADTAPAQEAFTDTLRVLATGMLERFIEENANPITGMAVITEADAQTMAAEYLATEEARAQMNALAEDYVVPAEAFGAVYEPLLTGMVQAYVAGAQSGGNLTDPTEPAEPEATGPAETEPMETEPAEIEPDMTIPPDFTLPGGETLPPDFTIPGDFEIPEDVTRTAEPAAPAPVSGAPIMSELVETIVGEFVSNPMVTAASAEMAKSMTEAVMQRQILSQVGTMSSDLISAMASSFHVDQDKIAGAFRFEMDQDELQRLMEAMTASTREHSYETNLSALGYADLDDPSSMSIYMVDFAGKEKFLAFLDAYNEDMEARGKEDRIISYTDITGIMMRSVSTIIDSVSYVLIAFVSVSLVVSSIMIGIITYISVMERTKEIGVLRAIGASKRNISQVFNAETFIIGLCSGILGVGTSLILLIPGNEIIHTLAQTNDINAQLPVANAVALVVLSLILTIIGGLIPSRKAANKDPVIALRTE